VPIILSQIVFALGACGGLATILMPSAVKAASKEPVNWPARSLITNLTVVAPSEVHQEVAGCLRCPCAVRAGGNVGQMDAASAVLDDDQGIEAAEQHGVHVDEVGGNDAAGLRGKELLPGRAAAAGRGIDPGVVQGLPNHGSRDRVA
jgi:hypothetical protein